MDVYASIMDVLSQGLGADWVALESLRDIVAEGRLGTKALAGFYKYSEEERDALLIERDKRYAALSRLLDEFPEAADDQEGAPA